ncbi:UNVERIFIED_CONTAM: hypothetical protein FKN15_011822 [Acipenser sinensis]
MGIIQKMEKKNKDLSEQMDEERRQLEEEKDQLGQRVKSLKRQLGQAEEEMERREAQNRHIQREMAELKESNSLLQKQLSDLQIQLNCTETYSGVISSDQTEQGSDCSKSWHLLISVTYLSKGSCETQIWNQTPWNSSDSETRSTSFYSRYHQILEDIKEKDRQLYHINLENKELEEKDRQLCHINLENKELEIRNSLLFHIHTASRTTVIATLPVPLLQVVTVVLFSFELEASREAGAGALRDVSRKLFDMYQTRLEEVRRKHLEDKQILQAYTEEQEQNLRKRMEMASALEEKQTRVSELEKRVERMENEKKVLTERNKFFEKETLSISHNHPDDIKRLIDFPTQGMNCQNNLSKAFPFRYFVSSQLTSTEKEVSPAEAHNCLTLKNFIWTSVQWHYLRMQKQQLLGKRIVISSWLTFHLQRGRKRNMSSEHLG